MSFLQYARFLLVGLVVGLIAIVLRESIARALPADTPVFYSLSIVVVYAIGILLSFTLHSRFTFAVRTESKQSERLAPFFAVALVGATATWLVSLVCRYGLGFDWMFGELAGSAAFAVGAVTASVVTYILNARMVFHRDLSEQERSPDKPTS